MSASSAMTIYLLRHGHTAGDDNQRRFIGQSDRPLSAYGLRQAQAWAAWFGRRPPACIVSSDLQRARRTAALIAAQCGAPLHNDADLREIALGAWEGLAFSEVQQRCPAAFARRGADLAGFRPPGGESFADLQQRVVAAWQRHLAAARGDLLLVTHAGVLRVLLCYLLDMPLTRLFALAPARGALTILQRRADTLRLVALNLPPDQAAQNQPDLLPPSLSR